MIKKKENKFNWFIVGCLIDGYWQCVIYKFKGRWVTLADLTRFRLAASIYSACALEDQLDYLAVQLTSFNSPLFFLFFSK